MDITYKLPHPARIRCTKAAEMEMNATDYIYDKIFSPEEVEQFSLDHLVSLAKDRSPELHQYYKHPSATDHDTGIRMSSAIMPYKFRKTHGNILTTSTAIDRLLEQTDIGDDIPSSYLRPPFKNCYIEFTEDRSSSIKLFNVDSGEHILEGVYISETEISPDTEIMKLYVENPTIDPSKPFRILELMFTGSPVGKSSNVDDALRIQGFYIQGDEMTINDELNRIDTMFGNDLDFCDDRNYLSLALNHMAKVLLFVNCKQYRDTAFNERKDLIKQIESFKKPSKISKYENKLRKTYDRIVIKPADNVVYKRGNEISASEGHQPKRAHWRKGHFRMQPYGSGASKRKVIFIEPTVVGGIFADKKPYDVKTK